MAFGGAASENDIGARPLGSFCPLGPVGGARAGSRESVGDIAGLEPDGDGCDLSTPLGNLDVVGECRLPPPLLDSSLWFLGAEGGEIPRPDRPADDDEEGGGE